MKTRKRARGSNVKRIKEYERISRTPRTQAKEKATNIADQNIIVSFYNARNFYEKN